MKIFLTIQIKDPEDPTVTNAKPTWTMDQSIIGVNPGIGIRPSQPGEDVGTSIFALDLKFDGTKAEGEDVKEMAGSKGYAHRADEFFKVYRENKNDANGDGIDCGPGDVDETGYRKTSGKFCRFDEASMGSCNTFPYGYGNSNFQPCVFVKFNRIMDLKPKPIKDQNNVDESLKKDPSAQKFLTQLAAQSYPDKIFIKCEGEYPADKEALEGNLKVYPEASGIDNTAEIPLKYFPYDKYRKGKNESPIVGVQFTGLKKFEGRLVHIICKAYYDGVVHSKKDKAGLVKFEMYLKTPGV